MQFLVHAGFLFHRDIAVYDNAPIYIRGDNDILTEILTAMEIDSILL